jgi:Fe2+ or Zn2+ uptake regulation protein
MAAEDLARCLRDAGLRVLGACTDAGLLRRVEPAAPARHETRTGDDHHPWCATAAGAPADVDCVVGARPCLVPGDTAGYLVDEAEVVFWGLCPDRQRIPPREKEPS